MCVEAAKNSEETSAIVVSIGIRLKLEFHFPHVYVVFDKKECKYRLFFVRLTYFVGNPFCHQLTNNMKSDQPGFTQIVLKFKTQILQVLNFRIMCVNRRKSDKIGHQIFS